MTAPASLDDFRAEVRDFLSQNLPDDLRKKALSGFELTREEHGFWARRLHQRGWAAPAWPVAHGGCGWRPAQIHAFEEECALYGAPVLVLVGPGMVAPVIIDAGSEAQKRRFLPRILDGSEFWCQGLSEPGAGSDLASLRCKAELRGDRYVVNGSKIWTSFAHWADWMFLLARTSDRGAKQEGISILLVNMKQPGIAVKPIISLDGLHSLNQVFLNDVEVPVSDRLGDENAGWGILTRNIGLERIFNGGTGIARTFRRRLLGLARRPDATGQATLDKPWFRDALAQIDVRIAALEAVILDALSLPDLPKRPEASLIKARGTEIQQDITRLITEVCGSAGFVYERSAVTEGWSEDASEEQQLAPFVPNYLFMRKASISSGTNEVQRNIIASHLLGRG